MAVVGEAFIKVRPDTDTFGSELYRDANGRLRDSRHRFAKAGTDIGAGLADGASKGFAANSGGIVRSAGGIARKAVAVFGAAFAGAQLGQFIFGSTQAASDLGESASKVGVVFGDASASIERFAASASTSLGQSQQAVLEATGTFGNLLRSVGLNEDQAAKFSTSMVQLSTDLASFNNADPTEVLEALRSGLVGETEPLKRFGINLNEAALQQKALELGLSTGKGTLDANAKAQAAYALIMEQTSLAQGDFARTAGGAANQQRILAASIEDAKVALGQGLLPGLTAVLPALSELVRSAGPALGQLGTALGAALGPVVSGLVPIIQGLMPIVATVVNRLGKVIGSVFAALAPVVESLAPPLQTIIGVVGDALAGGIAALTPAIVELAKALGPVLSLAGEGLASLVQAVLPGLVKFGSVLGEVFAQVGPILVEIGENVLRQLRPQLPALTDALVEMAVAFGDIAVALVPLLIPLGKLSTLILTKIQAPVLILLAKSVSIFATALAVLVKPIAALLGSGLNTVVGWLESFVGLFTKANLAAAGQQFVAGLQMIGGALSSFVSAVGSGIEAIVQFFVELPGRVVSAITALPGLLVSLVTNGLSLVVSAIATGLSTAVAQFVSFPFRVIDAVLTLVPKLIGFLGRLFPQVVAAEVRGLSLMVSFFLALPGRVISAVATLAPRLVGAITSALSSAAGAAGRGVSAIVREVGKLPGRILGLASDIAGAGRTIGGKIISGIKSGVTGAAGVVGDLASAVGRKLTEMLRSLIQKINDAIPDKLGKGPLSIGLPHNPIPNPFAFGGVTTEGRIDGTLSRRPEVVVPLSRGSKLAAQVARESGLLDLIGLGAGSPLFGMEVPVSVSFVGVTPTLQEATAVGRAIGDGIADRALAKRRVLADARTARV